LNKLYDIARNDGERRAALFASAVSYADEGDLDNAIGELSKQYESNKKINDAAAMAGNLINIGNVYLEMNNHKKAAKKFEAALEIVLNSKLSAEVKENNKRAFLFNSARVELRKDNIKSAKKIAKDYYNQAQKLNNPNLTRLAYQLLGMISMAEGEYEKAVDHLLKSNIQNPYNLYRLALSYKKLNKKDIAKEYINKAANFNGLNNLNYAFIRMKATKLNDKM